MRGAGLVLMLLLAGCQERVLHDLDELQANRVLVTLARAGVDAEKVRDGSRWCVTVSPELSTRALQLIEDARIIRRETLPERSGSLLPAKEERDHLRERQTAWALEQTLERLPGVLEARVHLLLQGEGPSPSRITSASVLLVADGVDEAKVREIVAGASGIDRSRISLVLSARPPASKSTAVKERPALSTTLTGTLIGAVALGLSPVALFVRRRRARAGDRGPLQRVY